MGADSYNSFMNGEEDGGQVFDADVALKAVRDEVDQLDLISRSGRPAPASAETPDALADTLTPSTADTLMPMEVGADDERPRGDDPTETIDDPRIPPDQAFFKIGEVADIVGVKPYVLRYWENEFPWVRPEKTSSRQRRYRRQDVAVLLQIRRLRYDEQLTVARARELIRDSRRRDAPPGLPTSLQPGAAPMTAPPAPTGIDPDALGDELEQMRGILVGLLEAARD